MLTYVTHLQHDTSSFCHGVGDMGAVSLRLTVLRPARVRERVLDEWSAGSEQNAWQDENRVTLEVVARYWARLDIGAIGGSPDIF